MRYLKLLLLSILTWKVSSTDPITCLNGGFQVNSTFCNCPNFWNGAVCDQIVCLNGGYPAVYPNLTLIEPQRCICPPGYLGIHCDAVTLITSPETTFDAPPNTFNLVYINLFSNYWGGQAFTQFQKSVGNHIDKYSTTYSTYNALYSTGVIDKTNLENETAYAFEMDSKTSPSDFIGIVASPVHPKYYSCYTVPIYRQLINFVQKYSLLETAITIFTQHPLTSDSDQAEFLQLALALQIRINVIWSNDEVFVRCHPPDLVDFRELSRVTGGVFATIKQIESHGPNPVMDSVLMTHYAYQPVALSSATSDSFTLTFRADPPPAKVYYIVTSGVTDLDITGCPSFNSTGQTVQVVSDDNVMFYNVLFAINQCSLTMKGSVGSSATVFTNDLNRYRMYVSYVEDMSIDSSNCQPDTGNPLYVSLHVEKGSPTAQISSLTVLGGDQPQTLPLIPRSTSTFDMVTNGTFMCNSAINAWWISVQMSNRGLPLTRVIPLKCYPVSSNFPQTTTITTLGTTETSTTSTQASTSTTTFMSSTTAQALPSCTDTFNRPTFALAYPATINEDHYQTFLLAAYNQGSVQFSNFGEILFETTEPLNYTAQDDHTTFYQYIYNYRPPTSGTPTSAATPSQVLDALKKIMSSTTTTNQNSIVSILLDKLPTTLTDFSPFYSQVNQNTRLQMFMDLGALTTQLSFPSRTTSPLNQLATMTGGHFIVSDQDDYNTFTKILQEVFISGSAQNLVLSNNHKPGPPSLMGQIDFSSFSDPVDVTITATFAVNKAEDLNNNNPRVQLIFSSSSGVQSIYLQRAANSNYLSAKITLNAELYDVRTLYVGGTANIDLRIWTVRNGPDVEISFTDLQYSSLDSPDNINGAALTVELFDTTTTQLSLTITDCEGPVQVFDSKQLVFTDQYDSCATGRFVPFFCKSQRTSGNCVPGTENIYQVQISDSSNFFASKSFVCEQSNDSPTANCDQTDKNGNYICGGVALPYTRGPTGKLVDCSNNGQLVYNATFGNDTIAPYQCNCFQNAKGISCEQGSCNQPNQAGGTLDTMYRTYTVIVGIRKPTDIPQLILDDASQATLIDASDNIWQYQLILYCSPNQVYSLYIGGSYADFKSAFSSFPKDLVCSHVDTFDVNAILNSAVAGVGRQQRGLIVFYNENPSIMRADSEQFIEISQQYRQEFYVVGWNFATLDATALTPVHQAVYSTGGSVIILGQNDDEGKLQIVKNFFNDLAKASTSLNFYRSDVKTNDNLNFVVESSSAKRYLVASTWTYFTQLRLNPDHCSDVLANFNTRICTLDSGSYTIQVRDGTEFISVIVLDGVTPTASILSNKGSDDKATALPVSYTVSSPNLAVNLPSPYTILANEDAFARVASRHQCTFDTVTYSLLEALKPGPNAFVLDIGDGTGWKIATKAFVVGVTSRIRCLNGGTQNSMAGYCICPAGFTGADCSQPLCSGGLLSTWGSTCNCKDATMKGRTCSQAITLF